MRADTAVTGVDRTTVDEQQLQFEIEKMDMRVLRLGQAKVVVFTFVNMIYGVNFVGGKYNPVWAVRSSTSIPKWISILLFSLAFTIHLVALVLYGYEIFINVWDAEAEDKFNQLNQGASAVLGLYALSVNNLLSWSFLRSVQALSACIAGDSGVASAEAAAAAAAAPPPSISVSTKSLFTTATTPVSSDRKAPIFSFSRVPRYCPAPITTTIVKSPTSPSSASSAAPFLYHQHHAAIKAGRRGLALLTAMCVVSFSNLFLYAVQLVVTNSYWTITLHVIFECRSYSSAGLLYGVLVRCEVVPGGGAELKDA
ncbi:hypothetical protein HDU87_004211 [Geranomyces variabilis]|uniref:Uncharacterized protein n=1 Tax=Geranomyces variabilis TaxID=109894 RepID=A0AAD5XM74_9FUNG|nr:hypothetical protein HDU87_004211 [Geranomyces variabilis]